MRLAYVLAFSAIVAVTEAAPTEITEVNEIGQPRLPDEQSRFQYPTLTEATPSHSEITAAPFNEAIPYEVRRASKAYNMDDPKRDTDECHAARKARKELQCKYDEQARIMDSVTDLFAPLLAPEKGLPSSKLVDAEQQKFCKMDQCDQEVVNKVMKNLAKACLTSQEEQVEMQSEADRYYLHREMGCTLDKDGKLLMTKTLEGLEALAASEANVFLRLSRYLGSLVRSFSESSARSPFSPVKKETEVYCAIDNQRVLAKGLEYFRENDVLSRNTSLRDILYMLRNVFGTSCKDALIPELETELENVRKYEIDVRRKEKVIAAFQKSVQKIKI